MQKMHGATFKNKYDNTMKKITTLSLCLIIGIMISAQKVNYGISAGLDVARMALVEASGRPLMNKPGLTGGIFAEVGFGKTISFQVEGNYSQQGGAAMNELATDFLAYSLNYITVPFLVKLHGTPNLSFYGGPQLGILMSAVERRTAMTTDLKTRVRQQDYAAVLGAEYKFNNGLFVTGRYHLGLNNTQAITGPVTFKNRYFTYKIGYSFKF